MGSKISTVHHASNTNASLPIANKGQVITIHSSSKWRSHFESSKKTSKLVILYVPFMMMIMMKMMVLLLQHLLCLVSWVAGCPVGPAGEEEDPEGDKQRQEVDVETECHLKHL